MTNEWDVVVVGGGPAGLTAGAYAARNGARTLVLEKGFCGGQLLYAPKIANFPAVSEMKGFDLANRFKQFAENSDVIIHETEEVLSIDEKENRITTNKSSYSYKSLVLAMGTVPKTLGLREERAFLGKGISYCALCDGFFFKEKDVVVVGGGREAIDDALYLSSLASSLTILVPENAEKDVRLRLLKENGIKIFDGVRIEKILGDEKVESIVFEYGGEKVEEKADGIFVAVGRRPSTSLVKDFIELDDEGFIKVDNNMRTNHNNIFACGDAISLSIKQVALAVGTGCVAGVNASKFAGGI